MQNAAKYAPGTPVRVRVWEEDATLRFEIVDDGPGFDSAQSAHGQGLVNMSDRIGAIGGTVRITAAPGRGTTVHGALPLAAVSAEFCRTAAGL
jgi:signal transduction histidine kinase